MPTKKVETRVFNTIDVVALYLAKTYYHGQMQKIREIVEFLVGSSHSFTLVDTERQNIIRPMLLKDHEWLGSLRKDHGDPEDWMKNIVRNHGASLKISKWL